MTENRFVIMKRTQTLHLLFISGFFYFTLGSSDFYLIQLLKSYNEAKSYCRELYTDLATIHNSTDMNNLVTLVSAAADRAWIGLETQDVRMWHWSRPDQKLDFFNWRDGEPQNMDQDACAAMDNRGKWFESDCGTKRSFVCHGNSDAGGHIFVAEAKSWRDAQSHCRGLSSDLISIHSREENEAVRVSQTVWIGLFKDPWKWSDGSNSSFRDWKPSQPNYLKGQDCVAAIFKDKGKWNDLRCVGKRFFVCRGERKSALTTPQQVVELVNFTVVASTAKSNAANFTTKEQTTSNLTTPNTTELVSSSSNNATTVMTTVTAIQIPPTTTVHTTNNGSALTTVMGTSAQTTTTPTSVSTESSQSPLPGNLILIQENMTWIDAMSYCKEHHIDLVHITTKDIQEKVVKKTKHATSPHVWLGLRYTCEFNFWFWTSSATSCYQNWAPGQGSESKYDCGVSGAIEATGRQQWVGLPETEKLNFFCFSCPG